MWHLFGQTIFNWAFCCYLHHQFFNWASVPGGRFSNSPTSQSPVRYTKEWGDSINPFFTNFASGRKHFGERAKLVKNHKKTLRK
jgi:hypothetical protein